MPKLRESLAAQTEVDALDRRLKKIENDLKRISQPGPKAFQILDHTKQFDPVEGEVHINVNGEHVLASEDTPVVYWHDSQWNAISSPALWPTARISGNTTSLQANVVSNYLDDISGTIGYDDEFGEGYYQLAADDHGIILKAGLYFVELDASLSLASSAVGWRLWASTSLVGAINEAEIVDEWDILVTSPTAGFNNKRVTTIVNVPFDQTEVTHFQIWYRQETTEGYPVNLTFWRIRDPDPVAS